MQKVGIIGAGAWGTALAIVAREAGRDVCLWAREREVVAAVNDHHENPLFLQGVALDPAIRATHDLGEAGAADMVLLAVPAQFLRGVLSEASPAWPDRLPAVVCAKGIERDSCLLMSEVVAEVVPAAPVAVLAGPSFAGEVARRRPTAVTLACADAGLLQTIASALNTTLFRIYAHDDVVGAGIGAAVKNVLAIACGIVEGRGLGESARAALITRGLAELARLARAKGARTETLMGLACLGDLVLTCTSMQSRNYALGVALGRGESLDRFLAGRRSVAEGAFSASSVSALARRHGLDMPICFAVDTVINHGADIDAVIADLLARPPAAERPAGVDVRAGEEGSNPCCS
ncbi:MAG: NAD(P)-dependent glycerol-3-phosphate dehydrogenase [Rhodospirillales bacterium]|nr:MAG: NAD(P)-dependent glycerol-3-phosphate dehydrogenase [Rhodospirillales bacterium]